MLTESNPAVPAAIFADSRPDSRGARAGDTWRNWSGSVVAHPSRVVRPTCEAQLADIVRQASKVRVVGAGHSFMPLCETEGTLVSLADMPGALTVAADRRTATVPAGWTIERVTAALWAEGLSLGNQGDIDSQAIAGAMATGTHGTGAGLGSLSTMARGFRLMLADGSVVRCSVSERANLFQAQRLSLGLLGIALEIELEVLPAYHLEERLEKRSLDEVLEGFDDWAGDNRHIEFFVFPYADQVMLKTLVVAEDDGSFRLGCELGAAAPGFIPTLQKLLTRGSSGRVQKRSGPAHRIFPSDRTIRFEEMEYELPRAAGLPTLKAAIDWIRAGQKPVAFPFEFRMSAGDDIWISPMNAGPVASVSMHQYAGMPWQGLFAEAEPIFRDAGGRPHWGKRHTLTRADVDALYPDADRFRAARRTADPDGKFLNAHLGALFE